VSSQLEVSRDYNAASSSPIFSQLEKCQLHAYILRADSGKKLRSLKIRMLNVVDESFISELRASEPITVNSPQKQLSSCKLYFAWCIQVKKDLY
jgi:hypothetical protein